MTDERAFFASSTVTVNAFAHDIWAVWADVNAWNTWNRGIEGSSLHANFRAGNDFTLFRKDSEPIDVRITSVTQGDEFRSEAKLPFGVIRTSYRMEALGELLKVTHEIEADIDAGHASLFAKNTWTDMQRDLSESLNELIDIVRAD